MKQRSLIISGIVLVAILITIFITSNISSSNDKIAWFDAKRIFDGFEYKQQLQEEYKKVLKIRERILDSLSGELSFMIQSGKQQSKLFEDKKSYFLQTKEQFIQNNSVLRDQYDSKILNQLKQYIKDFGKEKNISFLISINPEEDLMYASKNKDVTDQVILFVNQKYRGVKP